MSIIGCFTMALKLDQVILSSETGAYINYATLSTQMIISGTIASLGTADFFATIPYTRGSTIADVYIQSSNGIKVLANNMQSIPTGTIYTFAGSETCAILVTYTTGTIQVEAVIFNGDPVNPVTLITQTLAIHAVLYDAPFSSV